MNHPHDPDNPDAATIIDPKVIAERRARRAELNEGTLRERAVKAESDLARAQRQLGGAKEQRKDLAARMKQLERDLRTARQGEHAEAQRRVEIEEDAAASRREAEQEIAGLRIALDQSEQRVRELADELLQAHRAATEAQQASRSALAGPAQPDEAEHRRRLAEAQAELDARLADVRDVEDRLAAGRRELAARRGGLEIRLHDTEAAVGGLEEQLVNEREGRVRALRALDDERERAAAEVTLLQHELDRRLRVHEAVARQLAELRGALEAVQARVATEAERRSETDAVLEELRENALGLREELRLLEVERDEAQRRLGAARAEVAERDARLAQAAEQHAAAERTIAGLRDELDQAAAAVRSTNADMAQQRARLDAAEQAVTAAEERTRELSQELQDEREQRARAEAALHLTIAEERDVFQATVEEHRTTLQTAIARERASFETQMAVVRDGVAELRRRLADAEAGVDAKILVEREAREAAEARERDERAGYERVAAELRAERERAAAEHEALRAQLLGAEAELADARVAVEVEQAQAREVQQARGETAVALERAEAAQARADAAEQARDALAEELAGARQDLSTARADAQRALHRAQEAVAEAERAADEAIAGAGAETAEMTRAVRARTAAVEAERDLLLAERDARHAVDGEFKDSLGDLRAQLAQVRAQTAARADREAHLEALVNELVGTAGSLKAGFEKELAALATERDRRLGEQRAHFTEQLAAMETRVSEMRGQLAVAAAELTKQLQAERTARWAAEEQLRHERELAAEGRRNAVEAADLAEVARLQELVVRHEEAGIRAEERIVELEDELEQVRVALRPPPPMPPADHPALQEAGRPADPSDGGAVDSVIIDLARAAARLRTRREDEAGTEAVAPDEPAAGEEAGEDEETPMAFTSGAAGVDTTLPPHKARRAEMAEVEIGRRAEASGHGVLPRAWLTPAIMGVARRDQHAGTAIVEALIPMQAARLRQDLTYDLLLAGHPELRVMLHRDGTAEVRPRTADDLGNAADFRVSGSAIALSPLVGGGTGRRMPPGVAVSGRRRRARKLLKALRDPIGLGGVAEADVALHPLALLMLVAGAIDLAATKGERFTVSFAEGEEPVVAHLVVADGLPIAVRPGAPAHTAATVRVAAGALPAFLVGEAPARVTGDVAAVGRLLDWADAAQGLDG